MVLADQEQVPARGKREGEGSGRGPGAARASYGAGFWGPAQLRSRLDARPEPKPPFRSAQGLTSDPMLKISLLTRFGSFFFFFLFKEQLFSVTSQVLFSGS